MLKYDELKEKPREFLSVTSLTDEEFQVLLPTFERCYEFLLPPKPKAGKKKKQRAKGGGRKSHLPDIREKLLFILVYQKTSPLQTLHGLQCANESGASQLLGASLVACFADEFG
jgi:hypothetical protein